MNRSLLLCVGGLLAAATVHGCAADAPPEDASSSRLEIAVAPLQLTGIVNASYRITVTTPTDTVFSVDIDSQDFGDGAGSVAYIGPCDASFATNTVALELISLEDATGAIDTGTYQNPAPLGAPVTLEASCAANTDQLVQFNLVVMRDAQQGFFDIAVNFTDIFCSAKLDCGETTASADDINLLHNDGVRDMTAVLAFACTGGPAADTHLYLSNIEIDCGTATTTVVDVSGFGNVDLTAAPNVNTDGVLFGAQVTRGVEQLANKAYWTVALGLDDTNFPGSGACTLTTQATASDGLFDDGLQSPADTTYPVISWNLDLTVDGSRACTEHGLNGTPTGVATGYTPLNTPATFTYAYERATDSVLTLSQGVVYEPVCDPNPGPVPGQVRGIRADLAGQTFNYGNLDLSTGNFAGLETIPGSIGMANARLGAVDRATNRYVVRDQARLFVIDFVTGAIVATPDIQAGFIPRTMDFDPATGKLFTVMSTSAGMVHGTLDPITGAVTEIADLPDVNSVQAATGAIDPVGRRQFLVNFDSGERALVILHLDTGALISKTNLAAGNFLWAVSYDHCADRLMGMTYDDDFVFADIDQTTAQATILGTDYYPSSGNSHAYDMDSHTLWFDCPGAGLASNFCAIDTDTGALRFPAISFPDRVLPYFFVSP